MSASEQVRIAPNGAAEPVQPPDPGLWDHPQVVNILAERDIAQVFRILSSWCGYSQRQIASLTGQTLILSCWPSAGF
jgi:hypothetical protein